MEIYLNLKFDFWDDCFTSAAIKNVSRITDVFEVSMGFQCRQLGALARRLVFGDTKHSAGWFLTKILKIALFNKKITLYLLNWTINIFWSICSRTFETLLLIRIKLFSCHKAQKVFNSRYGNIIILLFILILNCMI